MRRILKFLTSRAMVVGILIMLQMYWLISLLYQVTLFYELEPFVNFLAIITMLWIINRTTDPSYKIGWVIIVLAVPVIGVPLYLMAGNRKVPRKLRYGTVNSANKTSHLMIKKDENLEEIRREHPDLAKEFSYGAVQCRYPVYKNTDITYFKSGAEWKDVFLAELEKAEHFIFLEYFIIIEGRFWDEVHDVLKRKAEQGVQVVLIYDDFGSVALKQSYIKKLRTEGIETYTFNRLRPAFLIQMNNRDHRKISVIDNKTAFTGGVNIADEYVDYIKRFGEWRDDAIMLKGEAVWSMTVLFIGMWTYVSGKEIDGEQYRLDTGDIHSDSYVEPFSDSPTDGEDVGMTMHLNLINDATKYIWINAPYLILNDSMTTALITAAKNNVDVRILTPHIPDKKMVFQITRGSYAQLLKAGVKIYEYTPGFNHAKSIIADDQIGLCGTINTDYRSYFLHFENGVLFSDPDAVRDIKESFEDALKVSEEITYEKATDVTVFTRVFRGILHLFVPLI